MPSINALNAQERYELIGPSDAGVGGTADSDSKGITLTANATIGSDGAYTQLIASTTFDYDGFWVTLCLPNSASSQNLVDIAIGAGGSEKIIIADIPFIALSGRYFGYCFYVPLAVAAGSRIAARIHRSSAASSTVVISLLGVQGGPWAAASFGRSTTYGTVLASAKGTQVDPGATANTRGAVTQIVASTTNPIRAFLVFGLRSQLGTSNTTDNSLLMDILYGPSTEKVLIPYLSFAMGGTDDVWQPEMAGLFFVDLPAAIRLSAQAQANTTSANSREIAVTIIAFD